jgi:hypothetical protein
MKPLFPLKTYQIATNPHPDRSRESMIKDAEIEKHLANELEGKVFEHVWVTNSGDTFFCAKDYYTVKGGQVFFIAKDGALQPSDDTLLSIKSECRSVGNYTPERKYKGKRNTMKQVELKKALKL